MTDRITEHYQENPEGARLVSDENIPGGNGRSASGTSGKKKPESSAEKKAKSGKASKAESSKTDKAAKSGKAAKSAKPAKSDETARSAKSGTGKAEDTAKPAKSAKAAENADNSAPKETQKQSAKAKSVKTEKSRRPAKKQADIDESGEQSQSVKTPSVMRLVEERAFSENQVIAAGKSLIPRQLRGIEPLSKVMRREAEVQRGSQLDDEVSRSPMVMRELTGMVIEESVPGILRRFNACDCEKCMLELARLAAEEIPARYMKMPELADLSWSGFSSDERMLIDSLKKSAVTVMIRLMIANKKRNFH